ncbi:MAG: hypothetical protein K0S61_721 [Anaerocolumna sp.]|nr:hypothetical protein [Anaerocolumna sp.]
MREYTDSEVVKLLQNNPKLEFQDETGGIALVDKEGILIYEKLGIDYPLVLSVIESKWILQQQSKNFLDISDEKLCTKPVKVIHPYLKSERFLTQNRLPVHIEIIRNCIFNDGYVFLSNLLELFGVLFNSEQIAEILKYGEWYLEE